jgi:5-hydroxyisourate hydrolase-like protein (transthyretin family)
MLRLQRELAGGAFVVLTLVAVQSPAYAAPHLRVRSAARIEAHATYADGALRLEGTLTDDAGAAIEMESVSVSLAQAEPPRGSFPLEPCPGAKASDVGESAHGGSFARTDEGGRFCVATKMPLPERCVANFTWGGAPLVEGATLALAVNPSLSSVELRFDPEPTVLSLEREPFGIEAIASFSDKTTASPPRGLRLRLTNELDTELGVGTTDASGRARFVLAPAQTGPAGKGELRVTFDGGAAMEKASHVAQIERHARVLLSVPDAKGEALPPGTPDEGVAVAVLARTAAGAPVPSGSVEALVEGSPVGAAPVENGQARLALTFSAAEGTASEIQLRYHAGAPWFESGEDVFLRLPVVPTSPWRGLPLLVAGLAVVAWLTLARARRTPKPRHAAPYGGNALTSTEARVTVVRPVQEGSSKGWTGRVMDAHDAIAIHGAEIEIVRSGFDGSHTIARTTTDETGRFELPCEEPKKGDELKASARLHATLRRRAPTFGEVEIALVLRRRALLDRLIAWARAQGAPFDAAREPTPAQVARGAEPDAARWARKVERAAFGPEEVDARVERDAEEGAPERAQGSAKRLEKDLDDTPR